MELNFDKEIDAILRKARDGEAALAAANLPSHPDADEISAFAENALPESAKMRYTAHLADCDRCRKILSNVILLNAETKSEIVHAEEKTVAATAVPWYRRLFQFPNLAYSLGALAIVFGGMIAFIALQGIGGFQNADVSQVSNKPLETKSAPASSNANSPANMANSASIAPAGNANSASFNSSTQNAPANVMSANTNSVLSKPNEPAATREVTQDDDNLAATTDSSIQIDGASGASPQPKKGEDVERAELPKDYNEKKQAEQQPITNMPQASSAAKNTGALSDKKLKKSDAADGETTTAGGKTFRRRDNVWYDTAYENQATTNVTRGTSEYKKLDKNLRVIVENLGGTVVIVWKNKAYRIR